MVAIILYKPPAATTNNNGIVTNKDSDDLTLTPHIDENLAQFSDPSQPEIDHSVLTIPNPLISSNLGSKISDIKNFLGRPVLCPSIAAPWTTALVRGSLLMSMAVPSALLNTPMYNEKVAGFYGFKGDLVLQFQTNAQKFQQGMLLLSIIPFGPMITNQRKNCIEDHIELLSQLPSVRHDISQTNESILKVPFSSPMLTHPLDFVRARDYATVNFHVYSPLTVASINYRCWCHFENVELLYPMAQSGSSFSVTKKANRYTSSDKEDTGGIVSTPLGTISKGVRQLGDNIPLISSFSQPTAWFLDSLSRGFASFGLSNTVDTSVRHSVVPRVFSHPYNTDINDTVDSFGYIAGNKISHLSGFAGTDADEMSIQHICSIPSFLYAFTWTTANAPEYELFTKQNGKTDWSVSRTVVTAVGPRVYDNYAPFAYIANRFVFWRGSIKYKFYCVKTNFHTGRILFSFSPAFSPLANVYSTSVYNTRYIWDISQVPTFEITIPYVSPQPWTLTAAGNNTGTLKGYVLNELEAVAGVSSSVEILVEVSAGPDFEVSQAQTGLYGAQQPAIVVQSGEFDVDVKRINYNKFKQLNKNNTNPFENFGLINAHTTHKKNKVLISYAKKKACSRQRIIDSARSSKYSIMAQAPELAMGGYDDDTDLNINQNQIDTAGYNALFTIGESLKSLRQILKRSNIKYIGDPALSGTLRFQCDTHTPNYVYLETGQPEAVPPARVIPDDYDYFAGLFALCRGGMIYRAISHATAVIRPRATIMSTSTNVYPTAALTTDLIWAAAQQPASIQSSSFIQGGIDVHVPFYSPTHSMIVSHVPFTAANYNTGMPFDYGHNVINIMAKSATGNVNTFDVSRQIADDFSFGGFIGVLPVLALTLPVSPITLT
jgi:hypothetical protein